MVRLLSHDGDGYAGDLPGECADRIFELLKKLGWLPSFEAKELRLSRDRNEGAFDLADREARLLLSALQEKTKRLEECHLLLIEAKNPGIDMERVKEERRGRTAG